MAAAAVGLQHQGINVFSTGLGTTLLLNFFITFTIPGISIGGHVGGAVAGALCGFIMLAPRWKGYPAWSGYATPAAVGIACVVLSFVVASSTAWRRATPSAIAAILGTCPSRWTGRRCSSRAQARWTRDRHRGGVRRRAAHRLRSA